MQDEAETKTQDKAKEVMQDEVEGGKAPILDEEEAARPGLRDHDRARSIVK